MADINDWVIRPRRRENSTARLFCFPYAGVGTSAFRGWAEGIGDDIEVCLIQLPGREGRLREPLYAEIPNAVGPLVENISALLDRPFAFYGHSLGAKIAFETARAVRRVRKDQPGYLFVSASQAPQLPWPHSPVRHLPEAELLVEVQKRYGPMPQAVIDDAEMRALVVPILRADIGMVETYSYGEEQPFDCGITAIGGLDDTMVSTASLEAWRQQTTAEFEVKLVDGGHLFLQSHREQLLRWVGSKLPRSRKNVIASPVF